MPPPPKTTLTLRGIACPINFVRTKIALEKLAPGDVLQVTVDQGEPANNVPRSAAIEGHLILDQKPTPDGGWVILIRRA